MGEQIFIRITFKLDFLLLKLGSVHKIGTCYLGGACYLVTNDVRNIRIKKLVSMGNRKFLHIYHERSFRRLKIT
jgi:hypothetical protein